MNIKRLIITVAAGALLMGVLASPSFASPKLRLSFRGELNPKACEKEGRAIINITEKVKNDIDYSAFSNSFWAYDTYTRHIKVWKTQGDENDNNEWCATIKLDGRFEAIEGQVSPHGTELIGSDVHGDIKGGYRATFNGTLKENPNLPTSGYVGIVDYNCDLNGICPGYTLWYDDYFDNIEDSFEMPWTGYIYEADNRHGVWINKGSSSSLDSLGNIY